MIVRITIEGVVTVYGAEVSKIGCADKPEEVKDGKHISELPNKTANIIAAPGTLRNDDYHNQITFAAREIVALRAMPENWHYLTSHSNGTTVWANPETNEFFKI